MANPNRVVVQINDQGQNSGNAHVDFATHTEALAAMSKDKKNMGHRYIELFLKSEESTGGTYGAAAAQSRGMGRCYTCD